MRKYDREFKIEAVRMASEPGVTAKEVERRLGIGTGVLSRWKRQFKDDGQQAFPGKWYQGDYPGSHWYTLPSGSVLNDHLCLPLLTVKLGMAVSSRTLKLSLQFLPVLFWESSDLKNEFIEAPSSCMNCTLLLEFPSYAREFFALWPKYNHFLVYPLFNKNILHPNSIKRKRRINNRIIYINCARIYL